MTRRGSILRLAALVLLGIALAMPAYETARAQSGPGPGGGPPGGGPGAGGPGGPGGGQRGGRDRDGNIGPGAPRARNPVPPPSREAGPPQSSDQEQALNAVRNDLALPLDQILTAARHVTSGKLVDASLETMDGELHYLLRMLEPSGDVREYFFNAQTAQLVRVK